MTAIPVDPQIQEVLDMLAASYACSAGSYRIFARGYGLEARAMRWFRDHYLRGAAERLRNPTAQ